MKKFAIAALLAAVAAPAFAWEGHVVACYDKIWVPAKYDTYKELKMAAHTEWEYKNGQMVKVHYPAIYWERKKLVHPGHYIARKAPCKH